ncbi:MAG: transposase [Calothrix sp. C42_A2020_038]|nr:transposase [Calothrix sp. C42_A2020_038]
MVKERKQIEIEKIMKKWGQEVLEKIEEVCIDMTGNYKFLVEKISPSIGNMEYFHKKS